MRKTQFFRAPCPHKIGSVEPADAGHDAGVMNMSRSLEGKGRRSYGRDWLYVIVKSIS